MAKSKFRFHLDPKAAIAAALIVFLPIVVIVASSPKLNQTSSNAYHDDGVSTGGNSICSLTLVKGASKVHAEPYPITSRIDISAKFYSKAPDHAIVILNKQNNIINKGVLRSSQDKILLQTNYLEPGAYTVRAYKTGCTEQLFCADNFDKYCSATITLPAKL